MLRHGAGVHCPTLLQSSTTGPEPLLPALSFQPSTQHRLHFLPQTLQAHHSCFSVHLTQFGPQLASLAKLQQQVDMPTVPECPKEPGDREGGREEISLVSNRGHIPRSSRFQNSILSGVQLRSGSGKLFGHGWNSCICLFFFADLVAVLHFSDCLVTMLLLLGLY